MHFIPNDSAPIHPKQIATSGPHGRSAGRPLPPRAPAGPGETLEIDLRACSFRIKLIFLPRSKLVWAVMSSIGVFRLPICRERPCALTTACGAKDEPRESIYIVYDMKSTHADDKNCVGFQYIHTYIHHSIGQCAGTHNFARKPQRPKAAKDCLSKPSRSTTGGSCSRAIYMYIYMKPARGPQTMFFCD
jgi:hypothetical protein